MLYYSQVKPNIVNYLTSKMIDILNNILNDKKHNHIAKIYLPFLININH